jgi:hypothetical protein
MSLNYAKSIPIDEGGTPLQGYPAPYLSNAVTHKPNCSSSSVLYLNPNTTVIEIAAYGGQGVAIRWVPSVEGAAATPFGSVVAATSLLGITPNFVHIIPSENVRRFVIPREYQGQATGQASSLYGLYPKVAFINTGTTASSVLLTEF